VITQDEPCFRFTLTHPAGILAILRLSRAGFDARLFSDGSDPLSAEACVHGPVTKEENFFDELAVSACFSGSSWYQSTAADGTLKRKL